MKNILNYEKFLYEYVNMEFATKILSNKKLNHSKRVADLTKLIKDDEDIYAAAVYHDFLERGGDVKDMEQTLTKHALELAHLLTNDEEEDTLLKLQKALYNKPKNIVNDVLTIKICDRFDNLKKRMVKNELSKKYIKKSSELIQWIWDNFDGDKSKLEDFITKKIFVYIPKISKKVELK